MLIAINKNPFQHEDVLRFDFGLTARERYVEVMKARMRMSVSFQICGYVQLASFISVQAGYTSDRS